MKIVLANPRGFCAGVDRAIEIVKRALELFGIPIYVRHEVVHNRIIVADLEQKGVIFVEHISEIPQGATAIYSAHGVSPAVREAAKQRNLKIFDATCPLVTKVHMEVARYNRLCHECILIGHADHPEVEGSLGHYDNPAGGIYLVENAQDVASLKVKNPLLLSYVTQTTLSLDDTKTIIQALKRRFPRIATPKKKDICYATQNRQIAVKELAKQCDMVLVLGSVNSSNSNRLKELAERLGKPAYLIDSAKDIQADWIIGKESIGITAGASAPEFLVQEVIKYLKTFPNWQECLVSELMGVEENVAFALPSELRLHPATIDGVAR
ncbi:MAG: 4-hydroxy-3-methylbut-2-enyl diphosphate reductase [Gammaproteobacteria bacterium]|nr:MAG: 4-hydroxy-3-methylbut-2-enyl diphosphate reductase [Gammaproteobacteria bacterium]